MVTSREPTVYVSKGLDEGLVIYSRSNAMVGVKHTRNAVKSKPVELIILHPET